MKCTHCGQPVLNSMKVCPCCATPLGSRPSATGDNNAVSPHNASNESSSARPVKPQTSVVTNGKPPKKKSKAPLAIVILIFFGALIYMTFIKPDLSCQLGIRQPSSQQGSISRIIQDQVANPIDPIESNDGDDTGIEGGGSIQQNNQQDVQQNQHEQQPSQDNPSDSANQTTVVVGSAETTDTPGETTEATSSNNTDNSPTNTTQPDASVGDSAGSIPQRLISTAE